MAMEIRNSYDSCAAQSMADSSTVNSTKKKDAGKTKETSLNRTSQSTSNYVDELQKLVPSAQLRAGSSFAGDKNGITLTVNPSLLEEMQNNPEKEKEMKELIKGVESAVSMLNNVCNASGWTVVFKHCYIDENGKFCSVALLRNDYMLNLSKELREEREENSKKLIEKNKERAAEMKEELDEKLAQKKEETVEETKEEKLDEKKEETNKETAGEITADGKIKGTANVPEQTGADKEGNSVNKYGNIKREEDQAQQAGVPWSAHNKGEKLLEEKLAASKDGMIYLYDTDLKTIMEAADERREGRFIGKERAQAGANLDLRI